MNSDANPVKNLFAEVDQIHLVHRDHHVMDAQQRRDERVAAGLLEDAVARIDQHDGQVRGGGSCGHVARVLFVARAYRR